MGSIPAEVVHSCPASVIVADKLTLRLIGVFGMCLNTIDAFKNKLGIVRRRETTPRSRNGATSLTAAERASIMRGVDKVYDLHDPCGRRAQPASRKGARHRRGRVWSGEDALGIGLIDTYGGLKTAIAIAVNHCLGDSYRVTEVIEEPTGFAAFIASLNVSVREAMTRSELGLLMKEYKQVQEATKQQRSSCTTPISWNCVETAPQTGELNLRGRCSAIRYENRPRIRGRFLFSGKRVRLPLRFPKRCRRTDFPLGQTENRCVIVEFAADLRDLLPVGRNHRRRPNLRRYSPGQPMRSRKAWLKFEMLWNPHRVLISEIGASVSTIICAARTMRNPLI